jgi:hypothetical protein
MASVFIGGSRAVSRLNAVIRKKLDELTARNCAIFVGDASGADKAIQQHFADRAYEHVTVYCMERCRNSVGTWPTKQVAHAGTAKDFAYYAAKDLAMARDAKCGVMLWDGRSKGTLNNIQNLVRPGKRTLVYFGPERVFHKLVSEEDLRRLLDRCEPAVVEHALRQIRSRLSTHDQLSLHPAR